mgnify:CR=1 FL=1|tara:strand:+ start:314 stop:511 length:198 start_codon:yes stop_codon:yes gene_type:complete
MKAYTFIIDSNNYTIYANSEGQAMEMCNRQIVDKLGINHMAWFSNDDNKSIPMDTYQLVRGNFFD